VATRSVLNHLTQWLFEQSEQQRCVAASRGVRQTCRLQGNSNPCRSRVLIISPKRMMWKDRPVYQQSCKRLYCPA